MTAGTKALRQPGVKLGSQAGCGLEGGGKGLVSVQGAMGIVENNVVSFYFITLATLGGWILSW